MPMMNRIHYRWHQFCFNLQTILLQDCLDDREKHQIFKKLIYHKSQMELKSTLA
ncbi:hypothetical protein [Ammoniphilus sp. YIM 78166]|uniref:hypothetical protein n=1 Tax=Ammoniphilus sp. YIM 78166 TaxID=1644106 RepID=UPI0014319A7E|nr:hypothetical protein [Ammoniphilus sp. YIM 78166]